jgi:hypothetical protein
VTPLQVLGNDPGERRYSVCPPLLKLRLDIGSATRKTTIAAIEHLAVEEDSGVLQAVLGNIIGEIGGILRG